MATNLEFVKETCEDCGCQSDEQFVYRVEEKRRLCDKCSRKRDATTLDVDAPSKWTCEEHAPELVKLYCIPCKKAICHTCAYTGHSGHKTDYVANVVKQRQDVFQEYLKKIGEKKKELNELEISLSKRQIDIQKQYDDDKDEITTTFLEGSRHAEKAREDEAERINRRADEEIRIINERREKELKQNDESTDETMKRMTERRRIITDDFARRSKDTTDKIKSIETTLTSALECLETAYNQTNAAIASNRKEQVSKADFLREKMGRGLSVNLTKEMIDSVCIEDPKVKFAGSGTKLVSEFGRWKFIRTIKFPTCNIRCLGMVGDNEMAILIRDLGNFNHYTCYSQSQSHYIVKLNNGNKKFNFKVKVKPFVISYATLHDNTLVCARLEPGHESELLSLFSNQGKLLHLRDIKLPLSDGFRGPLVCVTVDNDDMILVGRHGSSEINIMNPVSGKSVRTVNRGGRKVHGDICVTPSGLIVAQTDKCELIVLDESGVTNTIHDENWRGATLTVDKDADLLYIMYKHDDVTKIDTITKLDGDEIRSTIIEISPGLQLDPFMKMNRPQIFCSNGRMVVSDGKELLYVFTRK